jgi:O-antigen ligase
MLLPLILVVLVLPLGVAGQNIGAGAAGAMLFALVYSRLRKARADAMVLRLFVGHLALSALFVAWMVLASVLNPANPKLLDASIVAGYLFWLLLPPVAALAYPELRPKDWSRLERALAVVALVFGVVALTQYAWGWKIEGSRFVAGPTRAQGFYSHPLTFAYVALLLFPYGAARIVRRPRLWTSWAVFFGSLAAIYASQSRTVQVLAVGVIAYNVLARARGRTRLAFASVALAGALLVSVTDNPMRKKIAETLSGGHDVRSGYPDDRLAFWHAHWEMIKERPLLGHGDDLDASYRAPYYERIGLAGFERQYEAHNMFVQVLVNGGLIGLGLFLGWLILWLRAARGSSSVAFDTLVVLCLGGLTQNAFQDSEVRYALTLVVTAVGLAGALAKTLPSKASRAPSSGSISCTVKPPPNDGVNTASGSLST